MSSYDNNSARLALAVNDFHRARRKAALESVVSFLKGESADLLSYDMVRQRFRTLESARRTLEYIPIDKIVGSVNRYTDFSRSFLPRQESDLQRWASVRVGIEQQLGLPPIEVYKVGEAYFILDGHHRVSVARELGSDMIEAYVIPVRMRVPLSPGDSPDMLIIKSEYDDFLNMTHLDDLRSDANLMVTAPGQYHKIQEHIAVHQYFMGQRRGQPVDYKEAAADWYDEVYQPVANLIRERNLLRDFPGRTETDLYLWIMDHAAALSGGEIGWEVPAERAASDLVERYSPKPTRVLPRLLKRVQDLVVPDALEAGPPPGYWREHQSPHRGDHLFDTLLVTLPGGKSGWSAVRMAIEVARREEARLTGMHVVADPEQKDSPEVEAIRAEFNHLCGEAGVSARMIVESGSTADMVCKRSPWVDLVVFRMNFPPPTQPWKRLRSGSRFIIRRCVAPTLAVPDANFSLNSALLAYGPGRKADEALFVATYLAGRWNIPLTVLTVKPSRITPAGAAAASASAAGLPTPLERARQYLEDHGVTATYVEEAGEMAADPARAVLLNAEVHGADFLIMGGYESGPLLESLRGSTVDRVLRSTRRPVLICR